MRQMAVVAGVAVVLVSAAGPAMAKGPGFDPPTSAAATVTGPGLKGPIVLAWNGRCGLDGAPPCDLRSPEDPFVAMATAAGVIGAVPAYARSFLQPPTKATRGPAYEVVFHVAGADHAWHVVATLYPDAATRPWMYLGAGQTSWDRPVIAGWMPVSPSILTLLRSKGLPASATEDSLRAAAVPTTGSGGGFPWTVAAALAGGVLALLVGTGLLARRQHAPLPPASA